MGEHIGVKLVHFCMGKKKVLGGSTWWRANEEKERKAMRPVKGKGILGSRTGQRKGH